MQYSVDAHRIMSMSVGKMYTSRVQRGGIKLHKNLLLSLVLRSARDVCLTSYCLSEADQGPGETEPDQDPGETEPGETEADQDPGETEPDQDPGETEPDQDPGETEPDQDPGEPEPDQGKMEPDQDHIPHGSGELEGCDSRLVLTRGESSWTVPEQGADSTAAAGQEVPKSRCGCRSTRRASAPSTDPPLPSEDPRLRGPGSPHCGAGGESRREPRPGPHRGAACLKATRKRDADCDAPRTDSPPKRRRPTLPSDSIGGDYDEEEEEEEGEMDTGNVSSLISVFGAGFSGLLRKEGAGAETEAEVFAEPSLGSLNPWGTAIEAF